MNIKKFLAVLLVIIFIISVAGITVYARGGHHNNARNTVVQTQTRFEICAVSNCSIAGPHQHDNIWHCSRSWLQDGLGLCPFADDCDVRGLHEHDGAYYHCAYYDNGVNSAGRNGCCKK